MLKLSHIIKNYEVGDLKVQALKGIDIEIREHEFVSILGQSGCGKTTLLNIIGGLDEGDQVQVLGQEGDWVQIEYDGQTGYVYSGLLQ